MANVTRRRWGAVVLLGWGLQNPPIPRGPRAVFEPTGSQRDAASAIFNLPDYRVIDAVTGAEGVRLVEVESPAPPGCPVCGVLAGRVHSRRRQRLRDLPVAGPIEVVWVKRRWFCD